MTTESTWTDAESACAEDGSHLASVHSPEENLFIVKITDQGDGNDPLYPWLGGHYDPSLTWSDGQSVSCYHNFTDKSDMDYVSQNVSGDPQCLIINRLRVLGRWGRVRCRSDRSRPYVCKKGIKQC